MQKIIIPDTRVPSKLVPIKAMVALANESLVGCSLHHPGRPSNAFIMK